MKKCIIPIFFPFPTLLLLPLRVEEKYLLHKRRREASRWELGGRIRYLKREQEIYLTFSPAGLLGKQLNY